MPMLPTALSTSHLLSPGNAGLYAVVDRSLLACWQYAGARASGNEATFCSGDGLWSDICWKDIHNAGMGSQQYNQTSNVIRSLLIAYSTLQDVKTS
jgi:hypothetical protein